VSPANPVAIRYDALAQCLSRFVGWLEKETVIHMPRIGCGLAGGSWDQVEPLLEEHLAGVGFDVRVYDLARDIVPSLQLLKSPEAWMPGQRSARPGRPGLDRSAACADAHEPVALAAATGVHAASTAVGDRRWPARAGGLGCGSGGGGP
jgi:hypothetical protein